MTGCVVGKGGTAEEVEEEAPWKKAGGHQEERAALGDRKRPCEDEEREEGVVHQVGNEEGASFREEGEPT